MNYLELLVSQNYNIAAEWYKRAANQGDAISQNNLGWLYEKGNGVSQSYSKAYKWYKSSSEQGWPIAQFNLGWLYSKGHGVKKDLTRAFMWWHNSGSMGYEKARKNRRDIAKRLKPVSLAKAKYLAYHCKEKLY